MGVSSTSDLAPLRIGFVPLADAAPLVAALEKGFFARQGLRVELVKSRSWQQLLEWLLAGKVAAAHMLATAPIRSSLGWDGRPVPLGYAVVLSQSGNALTVGNTLWNAGVKDGKSLAIHLAENPAARVSFGVVSRHGTHETLLRLWLRQGGLTPGPRIALPVFPPQEMAGHLRKGDIHGFCAGEPWNQRAVVSKLGGIAALGGHVQPAGAEKVLAVRRDWHATREEAHARLVRALVATAAWCAAPGNRVELARLLAGPHYVNAPVDLIEADLAARVHAGYGRVLEDAGFLAFAGPAAPRPRLEDAVWHLERMREWEGREEKPGDAAALERVCMRDFYDLATIS